MKLYVHLLICLYDTCKDISYYSVAYLSVLSATQDIVELDDL